jgi:transposase
VKTVYITQKNQIRHLSKEAYKILRELCHISKNLYNVTLYNIRQEFFAGNDLSFESNYHLFKANENYKLLQAGVAQQTAKAAHEAFNSFLALKQKAVQGQYNQKVRMPEYLPKEGYYSLSLSTNAINIKDGFLRDGFLNLPISNQFKQQHPKLKPALVIVSANSCIMLHVKANAFLPV